MSDVRQAFHPLGVPVGDGERGLLSVVIPSYNRARLVGDAIDSVMTQTWPHVEAIVVDDGSTDDTEAAVVPWVARYGDRVRYIRKPNGGVASARNVGFVAARGEFIALLDSDDVWHPWKGQAQVELMRRHPEVGMVWTDLSAVTDDLTMVEVEHLRTFYHNYQRVTIEDVMHRGGVLGDLATGLPLELIGRPYYVGDIFASMYLGSLVHTSTAVLRRRRLQEAGGFDESFRRAGEDYDFHLRTTYCGPVALIDAPSILYRVGNADQITSHSLVHIARGNLRTVTSWRERTLRRRALSRSLVTARVAESHNWVGDIELRLGDRHAARQAFLRSLRERPFDPHALTMLTASLVPPKLLQFAVGVRRRLRGTARDGARHLAHA
jgi:glycosyltransferase involved in cell wall biosynthesis